MGPRSRDRGIADRLSAGTRSALPLQWGRGHVTAESSGYQWRGGAQFVASMGPRSRDRGIVEDPRQPAPLGHASMGPRSRDRGIGDVRQTEDVAIGASMGPRSRDRGILHQSFMAGTQQRWASMGPRSRDRG